MTRPNTSAVDKYQTVSWAAIMLGAARAVLPLILLMQRTKFGPVLGLTMGIQMRPTFGTPRNAA
ncbi:MAG TPA: hypothetical protein VIE65_05425 [Methylobacter sp.]|jgi:hypothetical protein